MERRVVITGIGLVTPLGIGKNENWNAVCSGKSGIGNITRFDSGGYSSRIAGEVRGFDASAFVPPKEARRMELFGLYAVAAAKMAIEDAGISITEELSCRTGVVTGCGLGGLESVEKVVRIIDNQGPGRVGPFFIPMLIGSMASGLIAIHTGAKGPQWTTSSACAASGHAIADAFREIRSGRADIMIAGGSEALITGSCIAGFSAMRALSTRNEDPEKASRPFDRDRDGFVAAEGAGIIILETLESALERGAVIYSEIAGAGASGDAYHITAPSPDGDGYVRCMKAALEDSGLSVSDIDYINAHGTSTPLNDVMETIAVRKVFGSHSEKLAISSTKSMTGHQIGRAHV
jgi:3-oxoacyl-[acyl-carrier-protein] synthase II